MHTSIRTKAIAFALMLLATSSAWAEWVKIGSSSSGKITYYIDPATIRKNGNLRTVWAIQNLFSPDKDGIASQRVKQEYDCELERVRWLSSSFHSKSMADGKVLFGNDAISNWKAVPPQTAISDILKIVCGE